VSAFTSANIDKVLALKPALVLRFSDLQADIAADLVRRGLEVHAFNQRSVGGIPNPFTSVSHNTVSASLTGVKPSTARFVILPCMPALPAALSIRVSPGITEIRILGE
jgi:hypothetical protein